MWIKNQIVVSLSEPELGLGKILSVNPHQNTIEIYFKETEDRRKYSASTAPIQRYRLNDGDFFYCSQKQKHQVLKSKEIDHLYIYETKDHEFLEHEIFAKIVDQSRTFDRLFDGGWGGFKTFDLRKDAWELRSKALSMKAQGLVGARITPIPHQLFIAYTVSRRNSPRVLLADEVGLGKTIEAGLIFSAMKSIGRADKVLIITPESLTHQWMAEIFRRFGEMFSVINEDRYLEEEASQGASAFHVNQKCLVSLNFLTKYPEALEHACNIDWDLIIVDEAHHLDWDEFKPSPQWSAVLKLSRSTNGLLLLTATPRQHGPSTQFGLLNLVDPNRFSDFDTFVDEFEQMTEVANISKQLHENIWSPSLEKQMRSTFKQDSDLIKHIDQPPKSPDDFKKLINKLVDRHGTGRVLFRNRRDRLNGFPQRNLKPIPLEPSVAYKDHLKTVQPEETSDLAIIDYATGRFSSRSFKDEACNNPKYIWLAKYLKNNLNHKTLLICSNKEKVLDVAHFLKACFKESPKIFALFHENLSILERDKEAASFADPDGPSILLSSEIGGEGRNFQFSHRLILLDLPRLPDLLEQRIGRLDRIGQRKPIEIYTPFLINTPEEVLFKWYDAGLNIFTSSWIGADSLLESFVEELIFSFKTYFPLHTSHDSRDLVLNNLIKETRIEASALKKERSESTDILLDINSFDHTIGNKLLEQIDDHDDDTQLEFFFRSILDHYGVEYDEIDDRGSLVIKADSLKFIDKFPGIPDDRDTPLAFDRKVALEREDYLFLTLDHSLVESCLSLLLDRGEGAASMCLWPHSKFGRGLILEVLVILEASGPKHLELGTYLPVSVKEFQMDQNGKFFQEIPYNNSDLEFTNLSESDIPVDRFSLQKSLQPLLSKTLSEADAWSKSLINSACQKAHQIFSAEKERMNYLSKHNPNFSSDEITSIDETHRQVLEKLQSANARLDSIRIIFTS